MVKVLHLPKLQPNAQNDQLLSPFGIRNLIAPAADWKMLAQNHERQILVTIRMILLKINETLGC